MLNKIKYKIEKQKEEHFWKKYNKKYVDSAQWKYVCSNDRNTILSKNVKFSKDWHKTLRANHVCVFGGSLKEQEDSIVFITFQTSDLSHGKTPYRVTDLGYFPEIVLQIPAVGSFLCIQF